MDAHSKKLKFLTKRENIKTNQTEMKSTITKEDRKMNHSRLKKEQISELQDRVVEITAIKKKKKKIGQFKRTLRQYQAH